MEQMVKYGCNNQLAYAEYGNKGGYPILVQHGLIASIKDHHLFHRLIAKGAHLICAARPGYGDSSPYTLNNISEWGDLVSILVSELNIAQFDVLGISSGAPYSYAIGFKLPELVRTIHIFSGIPALYDTEVCTLWPHPLDKQANITTCKRIVKEHILADLSEEDLQRCDIRDSTRNDCFGLALDLKLRCQDWGFDLSQIKTPVYMQHSKVDVQVPFMTAKRTAHLLPNCRLDSRETGEHFSAELLDEFIQSTMINQYISSCK